jgi:predicted dehydrogenase
MAAVKRIALMGMGFMGLTHAKYLSRIPDMRLAAIIDLRPRNQLLSDANRLNTEMGIDIDLATIEQIDVFSDLEAALETGHIDAAIICFPVALHLSAARQCLEKGLHVLVEKPFCLDVQAGHELIDLAADRNRILMVAQHVRFHFAYSYLKTYIDCKRLGQLKLLVLFRAGGRPSWGSWIDDAVARTSGGPLFDLQIHDLDFCNWVFGKPAEIRTSLMKDQYLNTNFTYSDGLEVCIQGGWLAPAMPYESFFIAQFKRSCLKYSRSNPTVILEADGQSVQRIEFGKEKSSYQNELEHFLALITGQEQMGLCTPRSCLESVELCYRILDSEGN